MVFVWPCGFCTVFVWCLHDFSWWSLLDVWFLVFVYGFRLTFLDICMIFACFCMVHLCVYGCRLTFMGVCVIFVGLLSDFRLMFVWFLYGVLVFVVWCLYLRMIVVWLALVSAWLSCMRIWGSFGFAWLLYDFRLTVILLFSVLYFYIISVWAVGFCMVTFIIVWYLFDLSFVSVRRSCICCMMFVVVYCRRLTFLGFCMTFLYVYTVFMCVWCLRGFRLTVIRFSCIFVWVSFGLLVSVWFLTFLYDVRLAFLVYVWISFGVYDFVLFSLRVVWCLAFVYGFRLTFIEVCLVVLCFCMFSIICVWLSFDCHGCLCDLRLVVVWFSFDVCTAFLYVCMMFVFVYGCRFTSLDCCMTFLSVCMVFVWLCVVSIWFSVDCHIIFCISIWVSLGVLVYVCFLRLLYDFRLNSLGLCTTFLDVVYMYLWVVVVWLWFVYDFLVCLYCGRWVLLDFCMIFGWRLCDFCICIWFSFGLLVSVWLLLLLYGFRLTFPWCPYGFRLIIYCFRLTCLWFLYGFRSVFVWFLVCMYDFLVVSLSFLYVCMTLSWLSLIDVRI